MSQFEKFKTSSDAAKHAESCGFEVIHGDEKTLLLDIDSGPAFRQFELNRDLVDQLVGIIDYTVWNSQNSKHHVKLKLKTPLSIECRLFLQACLGSDARRELLTYKRILEGEAEPSMLFRPRKWGNKWKEPSMQNQANPANPEWATEFDSVDPRSSDTFATAPPAPGRGLQNLPWLR